MKSRGYREVVKYPTEIDLDIGLEDRWVVISDIDADEDGFINDYTLTWDDGSPVKAEDADEIQRTFRIEEKIADTGEIEYIDLDDEYGCKKYHEMKDEELI